MSIPNLTLYHETCQNAVDDPALFARFRSHRHIRSITDTNAVEHGLACERYLLERLPHLLPYLDRFRELDRVGMAPLHYFPHVGLFNPTTLRHIVTAGRLLQVQPKLGKLAVVEIGGSYGALCAILQMLTPISQYTLCEMPPTLALARAYLTALGLAERVTFIESGNVLNTVPGYVISNYAFSEMTRECQEWYYRRIIQHSIHGGFMVINETGDNWTKAELLAHFDDPIIEPEVPQTHGCNYLMRWTHGRD